MIGRLERRDSTSTIRRYRDIARVLVAHGLADLVDVLHLGRYAAWGSRLLPRGAQLDPTLSRAARIRLTLEELGPTFVKFGQALSVRSDVLPPDLTAELSKLQDKATPLPAGEAEAAIARAFGRPLSALFRTFDPVPLAAASIAQVHRAELLSGDQVAVKIRRPGIGRTIAADIDLLRQLARLIDRHAAATPIDAEGLVEEFARTIRAEQDFVREGRNLERCQRNFADDDTVRFPRVHWDLTRPDVITLEFLDGRAVSSLDVKTLNSYSRQLIARRGADAMLKQVLIHGFFHADPHPGNLVVLPGFVIGFLDLGMVGRIDGRLRRRLARAVRAIGRRDSSALVALVLELAPPRGDVDVATLERDLLDLIELYGDVPLADLRLADVLMDVVRTASRHGLRIPSNLMLLVKAFVTIEGVGHRIDPAFRMVSHAAPLAERLLREEYAPREMSRRAQDATVSTLRALSALPGHLDAIGRKARQGRLEVQFVHRNLEHFEREMDRSSNRLALALVIAAIVIGSSLITQAAGPGAPAASPMLGLIGFGVAGLFGIGLAIGILRSGRL